MTPLSPADVAALDDARRHAEVHPVDPFALACDDAGLDPAFPHACVELDCGLRVTVLLFDDRPGRGPIWHAVLSYPVSGQGGPPPAPDLIAAVASALGYSTSARSVPDSHFPGVIHLVARLDPDAACAGVGTREGVGRA